MAHELRNTDYAASDDPAWIDEPVVHAFLARSHWAAGIPVDVMRRSLAHSLCFSARRLRDGRPEAMVGFARIVTDRSTFAYLCDVFVLEEHRGRAVSLLLLDAIMTHPDLQGLRRFVLSTKDAHAIYERFGFHALRYPERYMEIFDPELYRKTQPGG